MGIVKTTTDDRTGNALGAVICKCWKNVTLCMDVEEMGFEQLCDVRVKGKLAIKNDTKNFDLVEDCNQGSENIDMSGTGK